MKNCLAVSAHAQLIKSRNDQIKYLVYLILLMLVQAVSRSVVHHLRTNTCPWSLCYDPSCTMLEYMAHVGALLTALFNIP